MPRIDTVEREYASAETDAILDRVEDKIGMVPNIFATMAHSPRALEGFLGFNDALSKGVLPPALREQIALTVAGANGCDYCASAHTALGRAAGLGPQEIAQSLHGDAKGYQTKVILAFARKIVDHRARIDDLDVRALRDAGLDDATIVEIVAHVGVNLFTNYFNHVAKTTIDFPLVSTEAVAQVA